ncbi:MAG TPA: ribose 5-phosphate isomerase A, partial [Pseudomonadota bacterium]|nr:ribose 5-phosphate isomerase A [Pseudomonadota bacterium]
MSGTETKNPAQTTVSAGADKEAEQRARRAAGEAAAALVQSGMVVGLGTGDTAAYAIRAIAARTVQTGQSAAGSGELLTGLVCVATSRRSAELAAQLGLSLVELDDLDPTGGATAQSGVPAPRPIDLTIDGADEIDPHLQLVKGAGGALLFEKLVAQSSKRLVIIADPSKCVTHLGEKRLLPVEVVSVGSRHTRERILAVPGIRSATL